jgi:hypothetical protein
VNARNTNGKNVQIYVDKYRRMINVAWAAERALAQ